MKKYTFELTHGEATDLLMLVMNGDYEEGFPNSCRHTLANSLSEQMDKHGISIFDECKPEHAYKPNNEV